MDERIAGAQIQRFRAAGVRHEQHAIRLQRQHRPDVSRLPAAESHAHDPARQTLGHGPLPQQPADRIEDAALPVADRIEIAGVMEIRRGEQGFQAVRARPARAGLAVLGEPPARVPRHTEARHGPAQHQGFEPHLRADHIHVIDLLQQGQRVHLVAQHQRVRVVGHAGQIALLLARADFRVRLHDAQRAGMLAARGLDHLAERIGRGAAQRDAHVADRLVHDQDALSAPGARQHRVRVADVVVFGQAMFPDQAHRLGHIFFDAGQQVLVRGQHAFQGGFAGRIVIDAHRVHHHRNGRNAAARAERAQEAVLQRQVGHAQLGGPLTRGVGRGPQPPAGHGVRAPPAPAPKPVAALDRRAQQGFQEGNAGDPGGMDFYHARPARLRDAGPIRRATARTSGRTGCVAPCRACGCPPRPRP
ncbi:hypothetical protein D3C72_1151660 [compost metagenome]